MQGMQPSFFRVRIRQTAHASVPCLGSDLYSLSEETGMTV